MTDPATARWAAVRASTSELLAGLEAERWADADMRQPSLLPDWTRGHVLTHIARNADGITRTVSGALRGERVERYPGGPAGRAADIEVGASRPAVELFADVRDSADRLDRILTQAADTGSWELPTADGVVVVTWLPRRWREVEIHRVDLAGAYSAAQWPIEFVGYLLPRVVDGLAERVREPVRVTVSAEGSVTGDLVGRTWTAGTGDPVQVSGPDWAVLAWLLGRPSAAASTLSAVPEVTPWL